MEKYTIKKLCEMIHQEIGIDITYATEEIRDKIIKEEIYLTQVGYAAGVYGCNGKILKGFKTNKLYIIAGRTSALYLF